MRGSVSVTDHGSIGATLKAVRSDLGLSINQVAKFTGHDADYLWEIENSPNYCSAECQIKHNLPPYGRVTKGMLLTIFIEGLSEIEIEKIIDFCKRSGFNKGAQSEVHSTQ